MLEHATSTPHTHACHCGSATSRPPKPSFATLTLLSASVQGSTSPSHQASPSSCICCGVASMRVGAAVLAWHLRGFNPAAGVCPRLLPLLGVKACAVISDRRTGTWPSWNGSLHLILELSLSLSLLGPSGLGLPKQSRACRRDAPQLDAMPGTHPPSIVPR